MAEPNRPNREQTKQADQPRQEPVKTPPSILRGDWPDKLMWGAIKQGREGPPTPSGTPTRLLPVHQWSLCGIQFAEQTGRVLAVDHEGEAWQATGNFEPGCFFMASGQQVAQFLDEMRYQVVRWLGWTPEKPHCRRAQVLDTRMGLGTVTTADGRTTKTPGLYRPLPSDEPLAKYLVLLPADQVAKHGGRENVQDMPSVGDLEPSTLEIIKAPTLD